MIDEERYARLALQMIKRGGFTVARETIAERGGKTTFRVTATDDDGHTQVVDADGKVAALVELAAKLGFEDLY